MKSKVNTDDMPYARLLAEPPHKKIMDGEVQVEAKDVKNAGTPSGEGGSRVFVYVLTCFATLGGLLFGYDIGIVSGSMLLIQPQFRLSTQWQELIVSGTIGSAAVFALFAGTLADYCGRKRTIMVASVVFIAGAIVMGIAPTKEILLVGRIVTGIGVGVASMAVPVYIAESSPVAIRGRLVTINQLFITIGILASSLIAGAFSTLEETGWRYMLGLSGVPAAVQLIGFVFLPESPRWLVGKAREQEARAVLVRILGRQEVEEELKDIVLANREAAKTAGSGCLLGNILRTPHVRKALLIGCSLSFVQQACGINTVIYYSGTILKMAGFPVQQAIWLVVVPNAVNFLATFIGLWAVERFGRRPLILISIVGVMLSEVVLAVTFQVAASQDPHINSSVVEQYSNGTAITLCQGSRSCEACVRNIDCGFCYDDLDSGSCLPSASDGYSAGGRCNDTGQPTAYHFTHGFCPAQAAWAAVLGMVLFVFAFAPGLGPMPWTINSEIYPLWARGTCNSISSATCWVFNLVVSFTFLTLTETITRYGTFWLFCGISLCGFIFFLIFLPETRNLELEQVEQLFMTPEEREDRSRQNDTAIASYGAVPPSHSGAGLADVVETKT